MTSEEYVKLYYRDAKSNNSGSPYKFANKHKYTYITGSNNLGMKVHLGDGETESKAWVNAKNRIKETLKNNPHFFSNQLSKS